MNDTFPYNLERSIADSPPGKFLQSMLLNQQEYRNLAMAPYKMVTLQQSAPKGFLS